MQEENSSQQTAEGIWDQGVNSKASQEGHGKERLPCHWGERRTGLESLGEETTSRQQ